MVINQQGLIDRIKEAIGSEAVAQFADRAGLEANKLSKSFSGDRRLNTWELAVIAETTQRSVDWLLTGAEPPTPALAARRQSTADPAVDQVAERVSRYTDAFDVLDSLDDPRFVRAVPADVPALEGSFYKGQGERLADWAWSRARLAGIEDLTDLADVMESVFAVDVAIADLPEGYAGVSWRTDKFRLAVAVPNIYVGRQRFSLAHELGHILAADSVDLQIDYKPGSADTRSAPEEIRANAFAAAFLVPRHLVEAWLEEAQSSSVGDKEFPALATDLGISPQPLLARIQSLGLASPLLDVDRWRSATGPRCASLANRDAKYRSMQERSAQTSLPRRLSEEMIVAFDEGKIGLRPMATWLERPIQGASEVTLDDDGAQVA